MHHYFVILLMSSVITILIILSPFIAMYDPENATFLYNLFSFLCHQRDSRSICISSNMELVNCIENPLLFQESNNMILYDDGKIKYKFFVCARDVAIYTWITIGLLCYKVFRKDINSAEPVNIKWIILSMIPIAVDGGLQTLSEIGFSIPLIGFYESNNSMRILTGSIAGFAVGYAITPLVNAILKLREVKKSKTT